jgi:GTP-binding protein
VRRQDSRIIFADIPGLIEGAHDGRGLGDQFLRHVERTKILLHLIDMAGVDGRDPDSDYASLNNELKLYSKDLIEKIQFIAANKMDLPEAKENLKRFKKTSRKKVYPISAVTGEGVKELIDALFKRMK